MAIFACGINHKTTPISMRERLVIAPEKIIPSLQDLRHWVGEGEAAILSTCNRTEVYATTSVEPILNRVLSWMAGHHQINLQSLQPHIYLHQDKAAVRHLMRVACGLDSMVLGEPEIFGQIKQAYKLAHSAGTIGSQLGRLFPYVFATTKQVRTRTAIGLNPVTIAYAAVDLSKRIFSDLKQLTCLFIGAGETIERVAQYFYQEGVKNIIIANRHIEVAQQLADKFSGESIVLSRLPEEVHRADVVIAATASALPLLGKGSIESALKQRKHHPMLLIDMAVPRDIEPEVRDLPDAFLYNLDDLERVLEKGWHERKNAAEEAEQLIELEVDNFIRQQNALAAVTAICDYRLQGEAMRDRALLKAKQLLDRGIDPHVALEKMAHDLLHKLLHMPTVQMRQWAEEGRDDYLQMARELLGID